MRLGLIPETLLDRIGLATGFPPPALTETYAPFYAREPFALRSVGDVGLAIADKPAT
jgi:hypothetical protein